MDVTVLTVGVGVAVTQIVVVTTFVGAWGVSGALGMLI